MHVNTQTVIAAKQPNNDTGAEAEAEGWPWRKVLSSKSYIKHNEH